ncbi:MAG: isochorismatase family protein [Myxococcota bacterium]
MPPLSPLPNTPEAPLPSAPLALPLPADTTLMIVDVQERLLPAMPAEEQPLILKHLDNLVALFGDMGGRIVCSEQYPKGLGPTVAPLAAALAAIADPGRVSRLEKVEFSVMQCPAVAALGDAIARDVVLTGMETHVCVLQTGLDLLARGHRVWVPFDAVASRRAAYRENGLALLQRAGAVIVNTESLVFRALGRAGTDVFKKFSARIR